MIELVFVVCLQTAPDFCRTETLVFVEPISRRSCVARAQPQLARWIENNRKWQITGWSCQPAGLHGEPI